MATFRVTAVEVDPRDRAASCSEQHGIGEVVFAADLEEAERGDMKLSNIKDISGIDSIGNRGSFVHVETVAVKENYEAAGDDEIKASSSTWSKGPHVEHLERGMSNSMGDSEIVCTDPECRPVCKGYCRILVENYNSFPSGWPRLAAFLNTSDNFSMFRRFGRSHCRLLLHLQAEITMIEKKLDELDKSDALTPNLVYRLRRCSWDENWDRSQKDLLEDLKRKMIEYDDLLIKDNALRSLERPIPRYHLQVFNWIFGQKPLDQGHYDFINCGNDMVFAADRTKHADGVDRFVEWLCHKWSTSPLQRCLQNSKSVGADEDKRNTKNNNKYRHKENNKDYKKEEDKSRDGGEDDEDMKVMFFSQKKILIVAKLIAILISVAILLLPVFMLSLVTMKRKTATSLVLIFVLAFAMLMSLFLHAKADAVFLATCAYCAVLVTFLGSVQGGGGAATIT